MRQDYMGNGVFGPKYTWVDETGSVPESIQDERLISRSRKVKGWNPPKPYYRYTRSGNVRTTNITLYRYYWNGNGADTNTFAGAVDTSSYFNDVPAFPSSLKAKAEVGCLRKLKAQKVNFSVALGERNQTARLCYDTLSRLAELVREVRSGNPKGLIRAAGRRVRRSKTRSLDPAFDLWLEYRYGWLPLLSDVHGAVQALNEREKEPNRTRVSVKSGGTQSQQDVAKECNVIAGSTPVAIDIYRDTEFKCMVRLDYVRSDSPWASLSALGITNPLSVAWELVPWSFVADWFVPIGAYLDILDADFGWSLLGGSASLKTTSKFSSTNARFNSISGVGADSEHYVFGGSNGGRMMRFDRSTYISSPLPDVLSYLTTKFTTGNSQHVQNGIALFMSALTHKYRAP